mgnify:FL=1
MSKIFYLEDHLTGGLANFNSPEFTPSFDLKYEQLVYAVKSHYPKNLLTPLSRLYIVVKGHTLEAKTNMFKPLENLSDLVGYVERPEDDGNDNAVVVGVSRSDFEAVNSLTGGRNFWGTSTSIVGDWTYIVHTFGRALRRTPKYKRRA